MDYIIRMGIDRSLEGLFGLYRDEIFDLQKKFCQENRLEDNEKDADFLQKLL